MNLPFINKFKKQILPQYFLVLVLRDEKVSAVIFEELEEKIKIIGQKEEHFSTSIDSVSQEELLEKLDKAISQAESNLPENIQTQKTIFGVKESWTDQDQIKREYLIKLKRASEELGLTPIGFLVISQAISHFLAKEEGAPMSAILIEVNEQSITVTLIRAGKIIETKSSEIHESVPFTVDTLLKHFDVPEILPSRIIIFNGKEDLTQKFISHTWSKSLPFLHLPQITSLPYGFDAKAVLFGAATQMGFEVLDAEEKEKPAEKISEDNSMTSAVKEDDFGFAKDADVAKISAKKTIHREKEMSIPQKKSFMPKPQLTINVIISILSAILISLKKLSVKRILSLNTKMPKGKITFFVPLILFLLISLVASYFLLVKATVEIIIDPKITEQNRNVLFSTKSNTDSAKNIIKGGFVNISKDGIVSAPATGKKDVGTKAKGLVTIFSSLSESKTLAEGTMLKASNGLEFTLDSQINVKAVASHSADETVAPEKTQANATASELGKEHNLPSGTKFTIGSFDTSDLIAKNDNPFSGGTKKEVTVISKNDEAGLEEKLAKQLEDKAKSDLAEQIGKNKIMLPVFITEDLSKKSFNAKIGEEANQLTLTGTVNFRGIAYDKSDLIKFSKQLLEKDVGETQKIDYNNIKISVKDIQNKNDEEVEAALNMKALLLPKIDEKILAKEIKGKPFKNAEDSLSKLPQVSDINISLSPQLPFLPKNLPIRENNIKILIKING